MVDGKNGNWFSTVENNDDLHADTTLKLLANINEIFLRKKSTENLTNSIKPKMTTWLDVVRW